MNAISHFFKEVIGIPQNKTKIKYVVLVELVTISYKSSDSNMDVLCVLPISSCRL